jgi:hypothetical protein
LLQPDGDGQPRRNIVTRGDRMGTSHSLVVQLQAPGRGRRPVLLARKRDHVDVGA